MVTARVFLDADDDVAARRVCRRFVERYVRPECLGAAVHVHESGRYYKIPEHFEANLAIPVADVRLAQDLLRRLERAIGTGWQEGVCATNAGGKIACEGVRWVSLAVVGK
jgi:hypothetical protein